MPAPTHLRGGRPGQRSSRLRRSSLILSLGCIPLGLAIVPSVVNASAPTAPAVSKASAQADALRPEICIDLNGLIISLGDCPITTGPPLISLPITLPVIELTTPTIAPSAPATPAPLSIVTLPTPVPGPTSPLTPPPAEVLDGSLIDVELCVAGGLAGDALAECGADDAATDATAARSLVALDLCAAAGLLGDALAQCQTDTGGDSIIEVDVCVVAGLLGNALAQCQAPSGFIGSPTPTPGAVSPTVGASGAIAATDPAFAGPAVAVPVAIGTLPATR